MAFFEVGVMGMLPLQTFLNAGVGHTVTMRFVGLRCVHHYSSDDHHGEPDQANAVR
jgi:hypothetical protein